MDIRLILGLLAFIGMMLILKGLYRTEDTLPRPVYDPRDWLGAFRKIYGGGR